jgi:hypothetical protein
VQHSHKERRPSVSMPHGAKRTNEVKLSLDDAMYLDLCRLAVIENRKLADYLNHIIALHLYGAVKPSQQAEEMAEKLREAYGL